MIRRSAAALLALLALLLLPSAAFAGWDLDTDHTAVHFAVRYLGITTVRGVFTKMSGNVVYDGKDVTRSSADVSIDAASIDTRIGLRNKDLKSGRFLDVEKYPRITFRSKRVEEAGKGKLRMTGDLTIRDVTKEVVLDVDGPSAPAVDNAGKVHVGGTATTKINRKDFGVSGFSLIIGDDVDVTIDVMLVKKD